ncbi:hypothetical protein TWF730_002458 [Orbilia blumenaviensis]|uniref:Uncharacterized protein n=1 Tax=Orbilia blumenaviensis TaxID=1796055 RepID=A0AAV9UEF7_9PEZI
MEDPEETDAIAKYYADEKLFEELARQPMAHLYSTEPENLYDQNFSNSNQASLPTLPGTGNAAGVGNVLPGQFIPHFPKMTSRSYNDIPKVPRACDDLLERLRNGEEPRRPRRRREAAPKNLETASMAPTPAPEEPKVRYRNVSNDPQNLTAEGVPDWYVDAHKELKAKHPYDFNNFMDGYRFNAEGPSDPAETSEQEAQAGPSTTPQYSSTSYEYKITPIYPLNHPAVDRNVSPFQPPTFGRYDYSKAVSSDTYNIDDVIEKIRQYEVYPKEEKVIPTSGSTYVDQLRKSVRHSSTSQRYPVDLLDLYSDADDDEEEDLYAAPNNKQSGSNGVEQRLPLVRSEEKLEIPEIRVVEAEAPMTSAEETGLLRSRIEEPTMLTVPSPERISDLTDISLAVLQAEADARSVSEKSDGSANSYGDLFDYYSRTAGGPVTHELDTEIVDDSVADALDGRKRTSYTGRDHRSYVPVLTPLPEEPGRTQLRSQVPVVQETEKTVYVGEAKAEEVKVAYKESSGNTEQEQRVPMKPIPAYSERAIDSYVEEDRGSICDGTNFWIDSQPVEQDIGSRIVIEKPSTFNIGKPAVLPVVPEDCAPKPASIIGSDSPPHEIKNTNARRHPTIVHVEPTSSLPPPVPPKRPLTPELHSIPSSKTAESVYGPSPHPSMADIGRGMHVRDEDVFGNRPYRDSFDSGSQQTVPSKAMRVLGVGMTDIHRTSSFEGGAFTPFTPYAGSYLENQVNHAVNRKSKLDQEAAKSSKSLLGFRGGVSSFFRKRDKTAVPSLLNTDSTKVNNRVSVDTGLSTPDSPRQGLFKRIFNHKRQSDAPSTAPTLESYDGSYKNHESWDSSRASGDTGLTSNDEAFMSYRVRPAASEATKVPEYIGDGIGSSVSLKYGEKPRPVKQKKSIFFGREKPQDSELIIPGLGIPIPSEEKRGSVLGYFQKDREPEHDYSNIVDDIKQKVVEKANFQRSDEYARQKDKEFADKQKAKIIKGQKGYFNSKGEYNRVKNLLEIELCDSECSEPQSFSEVQDKFERGKCEGSEGPKQPEESKKFERTESVKSPKPSMLSNQSAHENSPTIRVNSFQSIPSMSIDMDHEDIGFFVPIVEEPEIIIEEPSDNAHEDLPAKSPVQPGFSPENEPPSHWSDDSDVEDNDGQGSQPTTPSNPTFGRSSRAHRRTGSGSSNLGTGPMFMKKAVRKFKANRKSAEVRAASQSQSSKGNRDSLMSQNSTGSNRNAPTSVPAPPPVPAPPVPAPQVTVPARDQTTNSATKSEARASKIPVSVPPRKQSTVYNLLTIGTYHDPNENVVHHFGGTIPERSGSSLGHRGDRNSGVHNLPERSKSSLGHYTKDDDVVREGIKCTTDVTKDDIFAYMRAEALKAKEIRDAQARKKRMEEAQIKEAEAMIKRQKKAAKADRLLAKEKKRQEEAIEKSKGKVRLATKFAGMLVQREAANLKGKGVFVPDAEINGWI